MYNRRQTECNQDFLNCRSAKEENKVNNGKKNKNRTSYDKAATAAFTGHRFYDFSKKELIKERLATAILASYEHGIRNFISGFAIGFDLMAAQMVHSMRVSCPGMQLTAAIPFPGQADRFKPYDRRIYEQLMAEADEVIVLAEHYYPRCFLDRDEFMVENASQLIAYYDGREKGGTYYTMKKAAIKREQSQTCLSFAEHEQARPKGKAKARGIPIVNVF